METSPGTLRVLKAADRAMCAYSARASTKHYQGKWLALAHKGWLKYRRMEVQPGRGVMGHVVFEVTTWTFDVIGAYLLALEAIKQRNLAAVRDLVVVGPIAWLTSRFSSLPSGQTKEDRLARAKQTSPVVLLWLAIGILVLELYTYALYGSFAALWLANPSAELNWQPRVPNFLFVDLYPDPLPWWTMTIRQIGVPIVVLVVAYVIGVALYLMVLGAFYATYRLLTFIEANTENGAMGIAGFVFFFVSASMKLIHNLGL